MQHKPGLRPPLNGKHNRKKSTTYSQRPFNACPTYLQPHLQKEHLPFPITARASINGRPKQAIRKDRVNFPGMRLNRRSRSAAIIRGLLNVRSAMVRREPLSSPYRLLSRDDRERGRRARHSPGGSQISRTFGSVDRMGHLAIKLRNYILFHH